MSRKPSSPPDALVEAKIERAVRAYRALLAPHALEAMEDALRTAMTTHPTLVALLDRVREKQRAAGMDGAAPPSATISEPPLPTPSTTPSTMASPSTTPRPAMTPRAAWPRSPRPPRPRSPRR